MLLNEIQQTAEKKGERSKQRAREKQPEGRERETLTEGLQGVLQNLKPFGYGYKDYFLAYRSAAVDRLNQEQGGWVEGLHSSLE